MSIQKFVNYSVGEIFCDIFSFHTLATFKFFEALKRNNGASKVNLHFHDRSTQGVLSRQFLKEIKNTFNIYVEICKSCFFLFTAKILRQLRLRSILKLRKF